MLVILIVALAASFLLTWQSNLYSNPKWGFEVQSPAGWRKTNEGEVPAENFFMVAFKHPEDLGLVFVGVYRLSAGVSLENFVSIIRQKMAPSNPTILSENSRVISGVQGWEVVGTYPSQSLTVKFKEVYLVNGQLKYAIHASAWDTKYDELSPTFEAFVQSFRLI